MVLCFRLIKHILRSISRKIVVPIIFDIKSNSGVKLFLELVPGGKNVVLRPNKTVTLYGPKLATASKGLVKSMEFMSIYVHLGLN